MCYKCKAVFRNGEKKGPNFMVSCSVEEISESFHRKKVYQHHNQQQQQVIIYENKVAV